MKQLDKMSIQEVAIEQINKTKKVYLCTPERMFSEYNGEKENVKNYNGRQLLEMLQNAEDAASKAKGKKKVLIKLQDNQLIIANTGHPFSKDGLTSIFLSHLSPKNEPEKQIGNKGLGFRSILSWANKVTIKSHDLCVAFSKEYSKKVLDELLINPEFTSSYNELKKRLKKQTKEAPISTLVCPEVIAVDTNKYADYSGYDTIILINLKETAIKEVIQQIEKDIDGEVLIFLNHLECIELNINGVIKKYNKENAPDSRIKLTTIENDVTQPGRFWNINTLSGHFEDINRDYQLSVAWKNELDEKKDVIYSHFRTKVPFHFFGILHGTFELDADRNDIISDEEAYNEKLIGLIPGLIANTAEKILSWLNLDIELLSQIEKDKEVILSKIDFNFHNAKYIKTISGNKFRNFLKWKLSNTAWLNTKSGMKQSPRLCTTSATITDEFSPLIEKPNIDIDSTIFRSNNIRRDKIDYLLNLVGVNETISSFTTNTLYSILSKLPKIDPEGKKAKPLYRELATNYDVKNLDISDAEYISFLSNGMVFCEKEGKNSYEKANTVFYVDNKRYGESVINQFFTIEVDRRKGKIKIEKMFGVKPLEHLKLNLIDQPNFHNLNGRFEQEIEAFKPYVYVFRQNLDNSGKEKNLIKDVNIKLVNTLNVSLELENEDMKFDLSNYEYFYLSENKTVFIKTPEYLDEEKKLKDDVHFCSTIAEVFSALIDVDAQRQQIRELFSKSSTNRDDIIRAELDDKNLEKLILAKQKLGITNDPKIQFWSAFVKCFPSIKIKQENNTDENLLEDLKRHFPDASEQISVVFDRINYDNYNEEQSLRLIIELLKKTDLSIEGFNKYVYPLIDISEIYELDFKRIKDEKQREFKQAFYSSFINSEKDKKDFLKGINQYDSIKGNFKNVIDYNIKEDLSLRVHELFQIDLLNVKYDFDIEEIYFSNKTKYEKRAEEEQISRGYANQFLSENQNLESLLHFEDEIENLIISLKEWGPISSDVSPARGNVLAKKILSIGDSALFYDDYSDLDRQLKTYITEGDFQINISKIKMKRAETGNGRTGRSSSSNQNLKKPKKPNEELGFLGESLVYNHLRETLKNKESIKWVSEYAKLAEINLDGKDGKGYDIEYIPDNAKHPRYVEVKVVGWDNAFHITSNEIIQGEKLKKHYEIFLVRNITDPENISIEIIQGPFDYKRQESFNNNEFFTVVNDSFILKFEKTG